jgi:hypothetical protein
VLPSPAAFDREHGPGENKRILHNWIKLISGLIFSEDLDEYSLGIVQRKNILEVLLLRLWSYYQNILE